MQVDVGLCVMGMVWWVIEGFLFYWIKGIRGGGGECGLRGFGRVM